MGGWCLRGLIKEFLVRFDIIIVKNKRVRGKESSCKFVFKVCFYKLL